MTALKPDASALLLTIEDAAAALNVGRSTVYDLIRRNELEYIKIGRCTRIPRDSVVHLIVSLRTSGNDHAE